MWNKFITPLSEADPTSLLTKLAISTRDEDGVLRPTIAGLLMTSVKPERHLQHAFIQAVAYRGTEITLDSLSPYQRDAQDIGGPLSQQILGACDFVRKNMQVAAHKGESGGRQDLPQFDMVAIFEALTNAVAHRDYSMTGSKIRLRLFDDRIELYVPGMLANSMTAEDLPFRQATRNEAITNLLARCPVTEDRLIDHRNFFMDRRAEGVPLILNRSESLSGQRPDYRLISDSELMLTIYAASVNVQ